MSLTKFKGLFSKKSRQLKDTKLDVKESEQDEDFQPAKIFLTHWDSIATLTSYYSADGGLSDYPVSGSILLGIWFKKDILFVRVAQAKDLPGIKAGGLSDPYVKTYILPDLSWLTKRKTAIHRKTNDPVFDTILKTQLSQSDIDISTLCVTVWDWDMFGRNPFLGEVHIHLSSLDLTRPRDRWYSLREKKCHEDPSEYKGSIVFSAMFLPHRDLGTLYLKITKANNLPIMGHQETTHFSVRIFLLPDQSTFTKKKTTSISDTQNPIWDEHFEYQFVSLQDLRTNRVLEVTVWEFDRRGCNDLIGCVRLGPAPDESNRDNIQWMDSTEIEAQYWRKILSNPQIWVEVQLDLRPTIASHFAKQPTFNNDSDYSVDFNDEEDSDDDINSESSIGLYSDGETRGKYPISGSLLLMVEYENEILDVHILNAKDLAGADSNGFSDPYVKLYLWPDKSTKRQTEMKTKTLNPVYNEIMQYEVEEDQLPLFTLWFSVWNWNRFGKSEFLGEVKIPLSDCPINDPPQFYELSDNIEVDNENVPVSGELILALKFEETSFQNGQLYGKLHIHIRSASHLANKITGAHTDSYVKMYLLPDRNPKLKRKTNIVKQNYYPTWNEWFEYDQVTKEQLSTSNILELTVWDHHFTSKNEFLGGLRLGPTFRPGETEEWMDSNELEAGQWEEMLANPGQWIEYCQALRPTMDYRDISLLEEEFYLKQHESQIASQEDSKNNLEHPNVFMSQHSSTLMQHSKSVVQKHSSTLMRPSKSVVQKRSSSVKMKTRPKTKKSETKLRTLSTTEQEVGTMTIALKFERISVKKGETYGKLLIHIVNAQELPCRSDGDNIDGYAKMYLLPDKRTKAKQKTKVIKNSSSPTWDKNFVYDKVTLKQLSSSSALEVTVWDHHVLGTNLCVGGIRLGPVPHPGETEEWMDSKAMEASQWEEMVSKPGQWVEYCHTLRPSMDYRDISVLEEELCNQQKNVAEEDTVTQLTLSIMFEVTSQKIRTKGDLHVHVKDAEVLPSFIGNGMFTKCHILPQAAYSGGPVKTNTIKHTSNPSWDEIHTFHGLFLDKLVSRRVLEVTLWDINDDCQKSLLGGLHIGPSPETTGDGLSWMDCTGKEIDHWEAIFDNLGEWIEVKHIMRSTMNL